MIARLAWDLLQWGGLLLRPRESLETENLFLRRQLALYQERGIKPKRVDAAIRVTLTFLSRWFDWRSAMVRALASTARIVGSGDSVSTSPAGAVSRTRREAEAGRCCHPSHIDVSVALVQLAIGIGDCPA